jgi:hypothetical protein
VFGDLLLTFFVFFSVVYGGFFLSVGEFLEWWWWLIVAGPLVFWYGTVAMYLRLPRQQRHLEVVSRSRGTVRGWVRSLRAYRARYGRDRLYWTTVAAAAWHPLSCAMFVVLVRLQEP